MICDSMARGKTPICCMLTQEGEASICYVLVPSTAVKSPVKGQEEIQQAVKSHDPLGL